MQAQQPETLQTKTILDFLQFDMPTTEQVHVLGALQNFVSEENTEDFMVVCGSAGTGKSSIMNAVVRYAAQEKISVEIAAPTGRAARIISVKTNCNAGTLHSMLFHATSEPENPMVKFVSKENTCEHFTIYIIDEASMINSKIVANTQSEMFVCDVALLTGIRNFVKEGNAKNKVIFVGDRYQLNPIGEKDSNALYPAYLQNIFAWRGTEYQLTEVKRQDEGSLILNIATDLRTCVEEGKHTPVINAPKEKYTGNAVNNYVAELRRFGPLYVTAIAATHKQNRSFNQRVREKLFGTYEKQLRRNDVLTIKRNWKRNGVRLYNGDTVVVKEADYTKIERIGGLHFVPVLLRAKDKDNNNIEITDFLLVDVLQTGAASMGMNSEKALYAERHKKNKTYRESNKVEDDKYLGAIRANYGYCITCNTAQGGEWEKVYLNSFYIPDCRWAYTGVTRAKNELVLF